MDEKTKKYYQGKSVLVTGGAGFIGSHLCEELGRISKVTSLDNYISGTSQNHHNFIEYIEGSCGDINEVFKRRSFDIIFHFGEYSRVEQSMLEPQKAFTNSRDSFASVLEYSTRNNSKLIYSGSSTKFCDDGKGAFLSPYTLSKAQNTDLLVSFGEWFNLNYAIVYFYNVYGGREISSGQYATVIAKYLSLINSGSKVLPVTLPGTQKRNFTHIKDVIKALLLVGEYAKGDGFGIGHDKSYSILEICDLLNCKPKFFAANPANRHGGPVVTEKTQALGWMPTNNLEEYLVSYAKKHDE